MTDLPLPDRYGRDPRPMLVAEGQFLMELADRLPDNPIIVQIGAGEGLSTIALLAARPGASIFSIDIYPRPGEFQAVRDAGLDPLRVIRILGDGAEAGAHWPYSPDMVFIDGDHREAGVLRDLAAWGDRFASPSSILALHDYHAVNPPRLTGVREALEAWVPEQHGWRHIKTVARLIAYDRSVLQ